MEKTPDDAPQKDPVLQKLRDLEIDELEDIWETQDLTDYKFHFPEGLSFEECQAMFRRSEVALTTATDFSKTLRQDVADIREILSKAYAPEDQLLFLPEDYPYDIFEKLDPAYNSRNRARLIDTAASKLVRWEDLEEKSKPVRGATYVSCLRNARSEILGHILKRAQNIDKPYFVQFPNFDLVKSDLEGVVNESFTFASLDQAKEFVEQRLSDEYDFRN